MKSILILILFILFSTTLKANVCFEHISSFLSSRSEMKTTSIPRAPLNYDRPLRYILEEKIALGEIEADQLKATLYPIASFRANTGEELLGVGVIKCIDQFHSESVSNFSKILEGVGQSRNLNEAFDKMIEKSQDLFTENKKSATRRICGLADKKKCALLSPGIASLCK